MFDPDTRQAKRDLKPNWQQILEVVKRRSGLKREAMKDKNTSQHKKKTTDSGSKAALHSHHSHFNHSAEKMSVDEHQSDSETQPSVLQRSIRMEFEDSKSLKMAESLIDDYREVLQHTFRNLSAKDPNFIRQAVIQDGDIEKVNHPQIHRRASH